MLAKFLAHLRSLHEMAKLTGGTGDEMRVSIAANRALLPLIACAEALQVMTMAGRCDHASGCAAGHPVGRNCTCGLTAGQLALQKLAELGAGGGE